MLVTNGFFTKGSYLAIIEGLDEKFVLDRNFIDVNRKFNKGKTEWELELKDITMFPVGTIVALKLVANRMGYEKENQKERYYKVVKPLTDVTILIDALEELKLEEVKEILKKGKCVFL